MLSLVSWACANLPTPVKLQQPLEVHVTLTGVPSDMRDALTPNLPLVAYTHYRGNSVERMKILYARSLTTLKESLKPYGYYHASITSTLTQAHPNTQPMLWNAVFHVTLHAPIVIQGIHVTLQGDQNPALLALTQKPPFHLHDILNQMQYEAYQSELLNAAVEEGYLDAHFSVHELRLDTQDNAAWIVLTLQMGPRYHFGTIVFQQEKPVFNNAFLERFLNFKTQDPYRYLEVQQLQNHLNQSQYFGSVTLIPAIHRTTHTVDLKILLTEAPSQQYTLGFGYGTETKLRGLLGWQLKHIGPNGQKFSAEIQASSLYRTFTAQYIFPGQNPLLDQTVLGASQSYATLTPYTAIESTGGIEQVHQEGHWQQRYGVQVHLINYSQTAVSETHTAYLTPFAGLRYVQQAQNGYFAEGKSASLSLEGAARTVLSTNSFLKSTLQLKRAWGWGPNTSFYITSQAGMISTNNLTDLAAPIRFYAGGVGTVRGYPYLSLSPVNSQGTLIGGLYLVTGSMNLERRLIGDLSGLLFYDVGNVTESAKHLDLMQGAGVGLSWRTAVGPIQFYLSHPVHSQGNWQFDLSVGAFL